MSAGWKKAGLVMLAAAVGFFTPPVPPAGAGWIVEEVDGDFPDTVKTWFFQDGKARVEGLLNDATFLIDLVGWKGYIVDERSGRYAGGTIDGIADALHRPGEGGADGKTEAPGQGAAAEERPAVVLPPVKIERVAGEESIAGLKTEHYRVMLDEEVVEELWIAPDLQVKAAGEKASFADVLEVMTGGATEASSEFPPGYEVQPEYRALLGAGYPVRRIRYYVGEKVFTEVRWAAERDLAGEIFTIPDGLEETDYNSLFFARE